MKYATLILGAVLLVASIITARAADMMPAAYHGTWCEIRNGGNANEYKRCREPDGEQDFEIKAGLLSNGEAECTPLAVVTKSRAISVRMECRGPNWKNTVTQDFQLSADGRRLTVRN